MSNDDSTNPFVRFKKHVDAHVGAGLRSIFGLPTLVSRDFSLHEPALAGATVQATSASPNPPAPHASRDGHPMSFGAGGGSSGDDDAEALRRKAKEEHVEALLDLWSGGSWADHQKAMDLFATSSAYSPLVLRRDGVPAPRPRDVPPGADPALWEWEDAFEDLLRASSALPMQDLDARWRMFPYAAPARRRLDLLARLGGLSEAYLPVNDRATGHVTPRTMDEWVERRRWEASMLRSRWGPGVPDGELFDRFPQMRSRPIWPGRIGGVPADPRTPDSELDLAEATRQAVEVDKHTAEQSGANEIGQRWKMAFNELLGKKNDREADPTPSTPPDLFDLVSRMVRDAEVTAEEMTKKAQEMLQEVSDVDKRDRSSRKEIDRPKEDGKTADRRTCNVDQVLSDAIHHAAQNAEGLVRSLFNVKGGWNMETSTTRAVNGRVFHSETTRDSSGRTTVTTKEEYEDEKGNIRVKVEVKQTDRDGKVLQRRVSDYVRPAGSARVGVEYPAAEKMENEAAALPEAKGDTEKKWTKEFRFEYPKKTKEDDKKWTKDEVDKGKDAKQQDKKEGSSWFWK